MFPWDNVKIILNVRKTLPLLLLLLPGCSGPSHKEIASMLIGGGFAIAIVFMIIYWGISFLVKEKHFSFADWKWQILGIFIVQVLLVVFVPLVSVPGGSPVLGGSTLSFLAIPGALLFSLAFVALPRKIALYAPSIFVGLHWLNALLYFTFESEILTMFSPVFFIFWIAQPVIAFLTILVLVVSIASIVKQRKYKH